MCDLDFLSTDAPAPRPEGELHGDDLRAFLFAGDAIFTLQSRTGQRYTYRLTLAKANPNYPGARPGWFAKTLIGPDNTSDYAYMGMVNPSDPTVLRATKATKIEPHDPRWRGLEWLLRRAAAGGDLQGQARLFHAGRCGRCNRLLTVPESVASGIGPECASKLGLA